MKKYLEIFFGVIGCVTALMSIWFAYKTYMHEDGGNLSAIFNSRRINNNTSRTIVVCLDEKNKDLSDFVFTPFYDNTSEYSIKDFSLSYTVESSNVKFSPTDFYQSFRDGKDKIVYKYSSNSLFPFSETERPFSEVFISEDISHCFIKSKATYDGSSCPFVYATDVWFLVIDNNNNLSYEDWRLKCKKKFFGYIDDNYYDAIYCFNDRVDHQIDIAVNKPLVDNSYEECKAVANNTEINNADIANVNNDLQNKNTEVKPKSETSSSKSDINTLKEETGNGHNDIINITSHDRYTKDGETFLKIFYDKIDKDKDVQLAIYSKKPSIRATFINAHLSADSSYYVAQLFDNEDEIIKVVQLERLKDYSSIKMTHDKSNSKIRLVNESDNDIFVALPIGTINDRYYERIVFLNAQSKISIHSDALSKTANPIVYKSPYSYSFFRDILNDFITCLMFGLLVMGTIFAFCWIDNMLFILTKAYLIEMIHERFFSMLYLIFKNFLLPCIMIIIDIIFCYSVYFKDFRFID